MIETEIMVHLPNDLFSALARPTTTQGRKRN